jgi:hypothetical protein
MAPLDVSALRPEFIACCGYVYAQSGTKSSVFKPHSLDFAASFLSTLVECRGAIAQAEMRNCRRRQI